MLLPDAEWLPTPSLQLVHALAAQEVTSCAVMESQAFLNVLEFDADANVQSILHRPLPRCRLNKDEREYIWRKGGGDCYLCKEHIPLNSNWHVEHVVAFREDPKHNDVLGNLLPAPPSAT